MLAGASLVAFGATSDAVRARAFYCDVLGLREVEETGFALVLDANGTELRLQKVAEIAPQPYTQLGWGVTDIEQTAAQLIDRGVTLNRYDFLEQDELGIWTTPDGAKILWFHDPDGNVLSLTQYRSTDR